MKHLLLTTLMALAAVTTQAQVTFQWGTATWDIENGHVYENILDYNANPAKLTFSNPSGYNLVFFDIIVVHYDIFVDGANEPIHAGSMAQGSTEVSLDYAFVEGHDYRIVTTEELFCHVNLATYTTDTLSTCSDSYTISFRINGPELVKTYDYKGIMSLAILDQDWQLTYSELDTEDMCTALGINDITEAKLIGLNANGSYNNAFISEDYGYDVYDGWHDADGDFTFWDSYDNQFRRDLIGHKPYPAVYCMKISETCDSILYYFYDYWRDYDPDDPGETPGGGITSTVKKQAPHRAPDTHSYSIVWDWDNGDGTITQYLRNYRCDEDYEYRASWIFKTDEKAVKINATMLFVSVDDYESTLTNISERKNVLTTEPNTFYNISGMRQNALSKGLNIIIDDNGTARKVLVK